MKAAIHSKRSSGKVLEVVDIDPPVPKPGGVLIRVRAASVNPLDWRLKSHRPGLDLAGEVVSTGSQVTRFNPGDPVFGIGTGAFAEYALARESRLAAKPDSVSFEEAASLPIAGLTALQGLRDRGKLAPGQKVLINGAAGGVGTFAVQIAKALGAEVTGVCSSRNVEMIGLLGADFVVDYTHEDFVQSGKLYDLILDNAASRRLSDLRRVMAPGGRCVLAGAPKQGGETLSRTFEALFRLCILQKFVFFIALPRPKDLEALAMLVETGKMRPLIDRVYPLGATGEAIAYLEEGHARGKVIIVPD